MRSPLIRGLLLFVIYEFKVEFTSIIHIDWPYFKIGTFHFLNSALKGLSPLLKVYSAQTTIWLKKERGFIQQYFSYRPTVQNLICLILFFKAPRVKIVLKIQILTSDISFNFIVTALKCWPTVTHSMFPWQSKLKCSGNKIKLNVWDWNESLSAILTRNVLWKLGLILNTWCSKNLCIIELGKV